MSYAGSITSQLLRAAIAGRTGYTEGQQEGGIAVQKAAEQKIKDDREAMLAAAKAAADTRTATLVDPNDPNVLRAKTAATVPANIAEHTANRKTDVANPLHDANSLAPDKAFYRMRSAYKAKLMAPTKTRMGRPVPGMDEASAEALTSQAWGPGEGNTSGPDLSTPSLMGGSILRGGGAAARSATPAATSAAGGSNSTSTSSAGLSGGVNAARTSSAPANDPKLNVTGGKKTGNIDLRAAAPAASAIPTGGNMKERDMQPADLWDKKVNEGMSPEQATAYVNRLKGTP